MVVITMAKRNARNEIAKKQKAIKEAKAEDKAKRQAGITKELKKKKKTGYYSHSKGI